MSSLSPYAYVCAYPNDSFHLSTFPVRLMRWYNIKNGTVTDTYTGCKAFA